MAFPAKACSPSLNAWESPRYIESVASVATIAGIATNWTRIALIRPITPPSAMPISAPADVPAIISKEVNPYSRSARTAPI